MVMTIIIHRHRQHRHQYREHRPSGGSGAPSNQNTATRKEEEQEASGEIAGDGLDWISRLSIFRYNNGVKILDGGLFMKKLMKRKFYKKI